jgi:hypothetical protein
MSFCRIKFNLIFIVYVIFYLLLNLMMSISEPADMTVFFQNVTHIFIEHHLCRYVCNPFVNFFKLTLLACKSVAAIVCPNKCYLLTYLLTYLLNVCGVI